MVEMVTQCRFRELLRIQTGQPVFGLALKFWLPNKDREQGTCRRHHIIGGDLCCLLIVHQLPISLQALGEGRAHARFMGATIRCWHRIAIGRDEPVASRIPADGPFDSTVAAVFAFHTPGEGLGGDRSQALG